MDTAKIRMKIGDHEFEAEGSAEIVQAQFQTFRELLSSLGNSTPAPQPSKPQEIAEIPSSSAHIPLERIMRSQGRIVSLTAMPSSTEDAALLIVLGNRDLRNNETVTGGEIGDGLAQSGRPVGRVDRVMEKLIGENYILKSGFRRATRYRLSNTGQQKALAIARELVATLP
jgi:hypothetical protein